jgi:hypothetical protein
MTHGDSHGPSSAPGARSPWLLVFGWLLALPGLWVILSFLLLTPLSRGAGRPAPQGVHFPPCPSAGLGSFART